MWRTPGKNDRLDGLCFVVLSVEEELGTVDMMTTETPAEAEEKLKWGA